MEDVAIDAIYGNMRFLFGDSILGDGAVGLPESLQRLLKHKPVFINDVLLLKGF
jgi:hypothetical protein